MKFDPCPFCGKTDFDVTSKKNIQKTAERERQGLYKCTLPKL